jgi:hypothetical protein
MSKLEELKEEGRLELIYASNHLHSLVTDILATTNKEFVYSSFSDCLLQEAIKELVQAYNTQKEYHSNTFKPAAGIGGEKINN